MARPLRLEFPGALYHLTARGNARQEIYLDDRDRAAFLWILGEACARAGWLCYAYCLMGNHYHLVVETPAATLSRGMRQLNGVYTQGFNRRHGRVGHLFQGRYKAILVEKEAYLLELCRYVMLNPVRAGLTTQAGDWPWSSYLATMGKTARPSWLADRQLLALFHAQAGPARRAFARFVREGGGDLWDDLRQQIYLGSEAFVAETQARIEGTRDLSEVPKAMRRAVPRPLDWYATHQARRNEAMAQAYRDGGYSLAQIAKHFGVHYSTVSRAVRRFEEINR